MATHNREGRKIPSCTQLATQFLANSPLTVGVVIKDPSNNYHWVVSHTKHSVQ